MPLQGSTLQATAGPGGIARAAQPFQVAFAQPVERVGTAGPGGLVEPLDGFFEIAPFPTAAYQFLGQVQGRFCITRRGLSAQFIKHRSEFFLAENPGGGQQVQQHIARSDEC